METKLLIIGKGDNIITMILDNLYSNKNTPEIHIFNNLNLPILNTFEHDEFVLQMSNPSKIIKLEDLENDYKEMKIHPGDLKKEMVNVINKLFEPVREYFKNNKEANVLLEKVRKYR